MVMAAEGGAASSSAAAAASSSPAVASSSTRGHLILKSHKPLPRFACAIPVPHPDASIQQLRSTIVAILTGQVSARSSPTTGSGGEKNNGASSSSSSSSSPAWSSTNRRGDKYSDGQQKGNETGLTYSEHLKQLTIQEWRMKSLVLELRQNALIAPETREAAAAAASAIDDGDGDENERKSGDGSGRPVAGNDAEEGISGFELQDEHECGLLEHGDEVNLWLKPGQEIDSLRLPKLSSKHVYGLPNQPALDRSGMILLGTDQQQQGEFPFASPATLAVREPAEPSSHSSSVSAHPDVQFETTARHWAPPQQHRVVVVGNGLRSNSNNQVIPPTAAALAPAPAIAKKEKPRRLNSMDYFTSQLLDPRAQERKQRESYAHHRSNSGPIHRVVSANSPAAGGESSPVPSSSLVASSPLVLAESKQRSPAPPLSSPPTAPLTAAMMASSLTSPPAAPTTNEAIAAQLRARQAALMKADRQQDRERERERSNRVSMKKMPSEALIVGPGVQGKFGRMASYDNYKSMADKSYNSNGDEHAASNSNAGGGGGGGGDTFGNLDAFVSFTAASSEAHGQVRPHVGRMRRPSNRSGASDKERFEIEAAKRPGDRRRQSSGKAERKSSFQSGAKKTTSSPVLELLPPMPMPRPINESSSSPSESWQDVLQAMNDSPLIVDDGAVMSPPTTLSSPPGAGTQSGQVEGLAELAAPGMILTSSSSTSNNKQQQQWHSSSSSPSPMPTSPSEVSDVNIPSSSQPNPAPSSSKPLSKAERRYLEVMKDLEAERERQRQDEKMRREAATKREEEKARALAKSQEEERRKKEIERWQVWEEVKARQAKEKERGYQ